MFPEFSQDVAAVKSSTFVVTLAIVEVVNTASLSHLHKYNREYMGDLQGFMDIRQENFTCCGR